MDGNRRILETVELPDGGRLVLRNWEDKPGYDHNLARLNAAGAVMWEAELPQYTSPNCFTGVQMNGGAITANTWSCHLVTLDEQTGKIRDMVFTK